ncbi:MAG: cation:proton antiporter [bacterium]
MEYITLQFTLLILIIISLVAVLVSYIRLPYTIALLIVGLVIGYLKILPIMELGPDLIFNVLMPIIVFEGAIRMSGGQFMERLKTILFIAFGGTTFEFILFAIIITLVMGINWQIALLLGIAICSTDPASVLAIFKTLGIERRLSILMEGESILDDGVAIVAFQVVTGLIMGGTFSILSLIFEFVKFTIGGAILGLILGYIFSILIRKIDNHFVELTTTTVLVYGTTLIAHYLGQSGVIAVLTAGLVLVSYGFREAVSKTTQETLISFWEYASFIVTSIIFLFIGLHISNLDISTIIVPGLIAFAFTVIARFGMIHSLTPLTSLWHDPITFKQRNIQVWGGLRGVVALALMLSLTPNFPMRSQLLGITFIAVFCSLIFQGLTIKPLVNFLGLVKIPEYKEEYNQIVGQIISTQEVLKELDKSWKCGHIMRRNYILLRKEYSKKLKEFEKKLDVLQSRHPDLKGEELISVRRQLIQKERDALSEALRHGKISQKNYDILNEMLLKQLDELLFSTTSEDKEPDRT